MHRPGTNPEDVRMEDVLCDFCLRPWTEDRPMVEGHRGSCICAECLACAVATANPERAEAGRCSLCLEERTECFWRREQAAICARCAKQASRVLAKDIARRQAPPESAAPTIE